MIMRHQSEIFMRRRICTAKDDYINFTGTPLFSREARANIVYLLLSHSTVYHLPTDTHTHTHRTTLITNFLRAV